MTTLFDQPNFSEQTMHLHNNKASQQQAEDNFKHFAGQTLKMFEYLMQGHEVTDEIAREKWKCKDYRARKFSIQKAGFKVSDRVIPGSHGCKVIFMSPMNIVDNRLKLQTELSFNSK